MPVTQGLLIANIGVFLLEASGMVRLDAFALWPPGGFGSNFEPWQLVTYAFLHGGLTHILFNMLGLYMFGSEIERLFGSRFYAAYYLGCVVSAAICHIVVTSFMGGPAVPMVGASGGIYGLLPARVFVAAFAVLELFLGGHRHRGGRGAFCPPRRHARRLADDPLPAARL